MHSPKKWFAEPQPANNLAHYTSKVQKSTYKYILGLNYMFSSHDTIETDQQWKQSIYMGLLLYSFCSFLCSRARTSTNPSRRRKVKQIPSLPCKQLGSRGRICHRLHRWHHADGNGYHCHCHRPAVLPSKKALRSTAESKHPAHERDVCFLQRDQPQFNSPFDRLSTAGNPQLCVQRR